MAGTFASTKIFQITAPSGTQCTEVLACINFTSTITGSGTAANPYSLNYASIISSDSGNALITGTDGNLTVGTTQASCDAVLACINLGSTLTGAGTSGSPFGVNASALAPSLISTGANNSLVTGADGLLYIVSTGAIQSCTDVLNCINTNTTITGAGTSGSPYGVDPTVTAPLLVSADSGNLTATGTDSLLLTNINLGTMLTGLGTVGSPVNVFFSAESGNAGRTGTDGGLYVQAACISTGVNNISSLDVDNCIYTPDPNVIVANQAAHGITVPTHGFVPVYLTGGNWTTASSTSGVTTHGAFAVAAPDANTLYIRQDGYITVAGHGLTVGEYYYTTSSGTISQNPDPSGVNDVLAYPVDANTIQLIDNRPAETGIDCTVIRSCINVSGLLSGAGSAADPYVVTDPNEKVITQAAHGFTLPSYGFIPVHSNSGTIQAASYSNPQAGYVTEIVNANQFKIKQDGFLDLAHGLAVGEWYFLTDSGTITTGIDMTGVSSVAAYTWTANCVELVDNRPLQTI